MADKVTKLKRSATATGPQKAQRKEGENKTSSFGDDVNAELARDYRADRRGGTLSNHSNGSVIVESISGDQDEHRPQ
jgi:hypothetical protein